MSKQIKGHVAQHTVHSSSPATVKLSARAANGGGKRTLASSVGGSGSDASTRATKQFSAGVTTHVNRPVSRPR